MLKAEMRKYIIRGLDFEDFLFGCDKEILRDYSGNTIRATWDRTVEKYSDRGEWLKYLKRKAMEDVKKLAVITRSLNEEGVALYSTAAGKKLRQVLSEDDACIERNR